MWSSFVESVRSFEGALRVIALDDSADAEVSEEIADILNSGARGTNVEVEHVVHPKNLGQRRSLEIGFSKIKGAAYIHLQEDWVFAAGTPWIEHSAELLGAGIADIVWLRQHPQAMPEPCRHGEIEYRAIQSPWPGPGDNHPWHGFTYNPGLRRTVYSHTAPDTTERTVDHWFDQLGGRAVLLMPPVVEHIGDGHRSTRSIRGKHPSDA